MTHFSFWGSLEHDYFAASLDHKCREGVENDLKELTKAVERNPAPVDALMGGKHPIIYRVSRCFKNPRWCRISSTVSALKDAAMRQSWHHWMNSSWHSHEVFKIPKCAVKVDLCRGS